MAHAIRDPLEATENLRRSPVHQHMQLSVVSQEQGVAILSMPLAPDLEGLAPGSVHGGMLATLADAASGFCLEGFFDLESEIPVTTDMHVRYYRQPHGGPVDGDVHDRPVRRLTTRRRSDSVRQLGR